MKKMSKETKRAMWLIVFSMALFILSLNFEKALGIIKLVLSAAAPVIAGLALAFILNIPMSFFEHKLFAFMDKSKHKFVRSLKKVICLAVTLILVLGLIAVILTVILPTFTDAANSMIKTVANYVSDLPAKIDKLTKSLGLSQSTINKYLGGSDELLKNAVDYAKSEASNWVSKAMDITMSVVSGLSTTFFALVVSIYALLCKDRLAAFFKRMLDNFTTPAFTKKICEVADVAYKSFSGFIAGQFTDSILLGILCYIGMVLFGFPYAVVVSVVVALAQLVPIVGGIASAALGSLLMLTESPLKAVMFLIFIIVVQQLEGNFIYPRIVSNRIGVPGIIVISTVIIGGNLFGILGILVGIPLMSTLYALVKIEMSEREQKKADSDCQKNGPPSSDDSQEKGSASQSFQKSK